MSDVPRMSVSELLVRYELEPSLRDVYVEGEFDKDVLSRCIREMGHAPTVVYEIDSVEISAAQLSENALTDGNKQRVIALARMLAQVPNSCSYRCIVDRDLDHWFGELETTRGLRWTAHSSLEMYFFTDDFLRDILLTTAKTKITNWGKFRASFVETLQEMYAFRLADRELGWALQWISVDRCLTTKADCVVFDSGDYLKRLTLKNKKAASMEHFAQKAAEWRRKLTTDPGATIRGHDFVDLLSWVVRNFGGLKPFSDAIALQRIFVLLASKAVGLLDLVK